LQILRLPKTPKNTEFCEKENWLRRVKAKTG